MTSLERRASLCISIVDASRGVETQAMPVIGSISLVTFSRSWTSWEVMHEPNEALPRGVRDLL